MTIDYAAKEMGRRIRMLRESLGYDQVEFAQLLGVASRETVSRWERGLNYPPANILLTIYQEFQVSIDWLVAGEGEMHPRDVRQGLVPFWEKLGPDDFMQDPVRYGYILDFIANQRMNRKDLWEKLEEQRRQDIGLFLLFIIGRGTLEELDAIGSTIMAWIDRELSKAK